MLRRRRRHSSRRRHHHDPDDGRRDHDHSDAGAEGFTGYDDHEIDQYAGTDNWICHPDLADDECTDLGTTVIAPDGGRTVLEAERADADDTDFDCFYAYPTTSTDPEPVADLDVDASERDTVRAQVGRYASTCRVFAPAYRQITLAGLVGGEATPEDRALGYGDILDAWKTYVVEENDGRGVVLIGHSQGAGILRRLIAEEIDPEPGLRQLLISALLLGSGVPSEGFPEVPPCATADDVGCVVSYASFPAASPPGEGALFGKVRDSGEPALCVDPHTLDPAGDALGDAVLVSSDSLLGATGGFDDVTTPFVSLPDAVRTSCAERGGSRYLAVDVVEDDPRPLGGLVEQALGPTWGLHLLDANLVQDDLIDLVSRQADVWVDR